MSLPKTPSDPNVEWHVLLRGERRGPYTPGGLRDLLEAHPDGWSASVWRPGMLDWRPAQQVESLLHVARNGALDRELPPSSASSSPTLPASRAEAAFILTPSESEVALRAAQTRTRAAPLFAATTHEMPSYSQPRRSSRTLYYVLAIASLVLLSALLLLSKWRAAPAATPAPAAPPAPAIEPVAAQQEPDALPPPPPPPVVAPIAPSALTAPASAIAPLAARQAAPAPAPTTSQSERAEASVTRVRVRSRWAPVRAAADPSAKVLCSVPRGTSLPVSGQRPGTHARWFSVPCDAQTAGWVHENFLAPVH